VGFKRRAAEEVGGAGMEVEPDAVIGAHGEWQRWQAGAVVE